MTNFDSKAPQSVEHYEGEGPIHRSFKSPNKLLDSVDPNCKTLWNLLKGSFEKYSSKPCFGVRKHLGDKKWGEYTWSTYGDVKAEFSNLASGLRSLGLEPKTRIGVYSKNRPEWAYSYLAAISQGIVVVPLYDTLGPEATTYIINHAELNTVISSAENVRKLLSSSPECPNFSRIILMDAVTPEDSAAAEKAGISLVSLQEVQLRGQKKPVPPETGATPDEIFIIMYTSGTTGVPKGVMLANGSAVAAVSNVYHSGIDILPTDSYISYLPMAHIYELLVLTACVHFGASVGFFRGDVLGLVEDIQALKPTLLFGVPRVFNRIYDKITSTINSSFTQRTLFNMAYNSKLSQLQSTGDDSAPLWNKLLFSKIAALLGGRVRLIVSGSAPLAPNVQDFLRICFCCKVIQGYGLTETCAVGTASDADDWSSGHVGAPAVACEIKLVDVPEMGYTSATKPQRGEVCIRGPVVFKGYYKMPEKTAEDLERNGWFHTGDIGEWQPNGVLKIIDRKKNIFKLAQGEYVAAEYLETVYIRSKLITQIFVYGDSFQNYLVAVAVPDPEVLTQWANSQGIKGDLVALCKDERIKRHVFQSLEKVAERAKLKGFEHVKNIHLEPEPWTVENNLLTPTMKAKRPELTKHYKPVLERLYSQPRMDAPNNNTTPAKL